MKVIITGMPRTGTRSLKLALEHLGLGKCYHMDDLLENPDNLRFFVDSSKGKKVNWEELLSGYQSISVLMIKNEVFENSLIGHFTNAKIIHTIRDSESWYLSMKSTIFSKKIDILYAIKILIHALYTKRIRKRIGVLLYNRRHLIKIFESRWQEKKIINIFNSYNERIPQLLANRQILIYNVESGWEPICNFLNLPVPKIPFPHINKKEDFFKEFPLI